MKTRFSQRRFLINYTLNLAHEPEEICFLQHEDISIAMFDYMYEDPVNGLAREFAKYGLGETDRTFIKEQIAGPLTEVSQYFLYFNSKTTTCTQ